jgi:hypothetical protein
MNATFLSEFWQALLFIDMKFSWILHEKRALDLFPFFVTDISQATKIVPGM